VAKNAISQEVIEIERRGGTFEDIKHLVAGSRGVKVYENGDPDAGIWSAGLCQGLIHDIPTCGELIETIMTEADRIINDRLSGIAGAEPALA
jgi:nitronate monooxygenase